MNNSLIREKGFQYSIRTAELVRYLQEKEERFPLSEKLLCCGLETGMRCRAMVEENDQQGRRKAADHVKTADFIIEMAVYAGYLTEQQSIPIREEGKKLLEFLYEDMDDEVERKQP